MYRAHIKMSFWKNCKVMTMDDLLEMLQMEKLKKCWEHEQPTKNENM